MANPLDSIAGGLIQGLTGGLNTMTKQRLEQDQAIQEYQAKTMMAMQQNKLDTQRQMDVAQYQQAEETKRQLTLSNANRKNPMYMVPNPKDKTGAPLYIKTPEQAASLGVPNPFQEGWTPNPNGITELVDLTGSKTSGSKSSAYANLFTLDPAAKKSVIGDINELAGLDPRIYPQVLNYGASIGVKVPSQSNAKAALKIQEKFAEAKSLLEDVRNNYNAIPPEEKKRVATLSEAAWSDWASGKLSSDMLAKGMPNFKAYLDNLDAAANGISRGLYGTVGSATDIQRKQITNAHPGVTDTDQTAALKLNKIAQNANGIYKRKMGALGFNKDNFQTNIQEDVVTTPNNGVPLTRDQLLQQGFKQIIDSRKKGM